MYKTYNERRDYDFNDFTPEQIVKLKLALLEYFKGILESVGLGMIDDVIEQAKKTKFSPIDTFHFSFPEFTMVGMDFLGIMGVIKRRGKNGTIQDR